MFVRFTTDFVIIQLSTSKCQLFFSFFCFIFTIFHSMPLNRQALEKESFGFFFRRPPTQPISSNISHNQKNLRIAPKIFLDYILHRGYVLYNSLSLHCVYNFFKSGNVSTYYIVSFCSITFCCVCCVMADVYHDVLQFCIYFFECPAKSLAVL